MTQQLSEADVLKIAALARLELTPDEVELFSKQLTDILAYACARPAASDDMHFLDDRYALIQPGPAAARDGLPPDAMILTSLLPTAPILMVNVCLGDRASVDTGVCGCPMAQEGWATRVRDVRSTGPRDQPGLAISRASRSTAARDQPGLAINRG